MVRVKRIILILLLFGLEWGINAQDSLQMLQLLQDYGFQNIRITEYKDKTWRIDLENGRYRFMPYGFRRLIENWQGEQDTFHFVFRERDIPAAHLEYVNGQIKSIDWDDEWLDASVGKAIRGTSNFWQVNIPIEIGIRYQIGQTINHERIALDLLPGIDISLDKGLSIQGNIAIPIFNDFDSRKSVRLNTLMVIKDFRLPERFFISLAGGVFNRNRIGLHIKWRKFIVQEHIAIGMDGAITEYTDLSGESIWKNTENRLISFYTFRMDYIWRRYNTRFEIHFGKFYEVEQKLALRAFRQFDEKRIGLELRYADYGLDGGFFVRWPILPRKYTKPSKVRVTGAPYFNINYSYRFYGHRDQFYQLGNTLVDGLWEYWPGTIERN